MIFNNFPSIRDAVFLVNDVSLTIYQDDMNTKDVIDLRKAYLLDSKKNREITDREFIELSGSLENKLEQAEQAELNISQLSSINYNTNTEFFETLEEFKKGFEVYQKGNRICTSMSRTFKNSTSRAFFYLGLILPKIPQEPFKNSIRAFFEDSFPEDYERLEIGDETSKINSSIIILANEVLPIIAGNKSISSVKRVGSEESGFDYQEVGSTLTKQHQMLSDKDKKNKLMGFNRGIEALISGTKLHEYLCPVLYKVPIQETNQHAYAILNLNQIGTVDDFDKKFVGSYLNFLKSRVIDEKLARQKTNEWTLVDDTQATIDPNVDRDVNFGNSTNPFLQSSKDIGSFSPYGELPPKK